MIIQTINRILNAVFDILFIPFRRLPDVWGLLFLSVLTGVLMLVLFRRFSDQDRIRRTKERMKAHLLELLLYRDDIRLSFIGLKDLLVRNLYYLFLMMKPMVFIMPPTVLILIQLSIRFESRPLEPGERTIVSIQLEKHADPRQVELVSGEGVEVETHPLWEEPARRMYWRIRGTQAGVWTLRWSTGNHAQPVQVDMVVGRLKAKLSGRIYRLSSLQSLFHPAEKGLDRNAFIRSVLIRYPDQSLRLAGFKVHWLIVFFVCSLIAAFTLKGLFGVVI